MLIAYLLSLFPYPLSHIPYPLSPNRYPLSPIPYPLSPIPYPLSLIPNISLVSCLEPVKKFRVVVVVLTVSLVFCFGPKLKVLVWNLDQAEQLSTCFCTSFCFCHLFIDPCWGRMYFFLYEFIYNILLYFILLFFPLSNLINFSYVIFFNSIL